MLDEALERISSLIEHEIVGELTLLLRDLGVRADVRRVDDRRIEACLHAVVQEHRIENAASFRSQAKTHVGDAEYGRDTRQLALDKSDALDGFLARLDPFGVAGGERESKRVVNEIFRRKTILADDDVVDLLRDLELPLAGLRHPDLVDGERDHRGAVLPDERNHRVDALPTVLHVDGVDDSATRDVLERRFDD